MCMCTRGYKLCSTRKGPSALSEMNIGWLCPHPSQIKCDSHHYHHHPHQTHQHDSAAAASLQSCPTLCDPIDGSPPGSPVPGILQAGTLEWVAISFSSAWKWKVKVKLLSHVRPFATPWTTAHQAPPSMGFFRQEYWSGAPLPSLKHYSITLIHHMAVKLCPVSYRWTFSFWWYFDF